MITVNELNKEINMPELDTDEVVILQRIENEIEVIIKKCFKNSNLMYYSMNNMNKLLRTIPDKRHKFIIQQLTNTMKNAGWNFELKNDLEDSYYHITPIQK